MRCLTTQYNSEEEESAVCSQRPNDVHHSFSSSMMKRSGFTVSNKELPVLGYPVTMLMEHSWGTSILTSLQAKETGITY